VVESCEIVGRLDSAWANKLGLKEGLPVVAGGIDAAVATLAAGVTKPGEHAAMIGTSMCWGSIHTEGRLDWRFVNFPYVINGRELIYSFGGATTSGAVIEWFKRLTGIGDLSEITQLAEKIPAGSDGLILLPFFMGERAPIWKPGARATLHGLSLSHGPAHFFRAVLGGRRLNTQPALVENNSCCGKSRVVDTSHIVRCALWRRLLSGTCGGRG